LGGVCATSQTTDANGRFRMVFAGPGDVLLTAYGATTTSVPLTITDDTDVVIQLQAAPPTTGQVLAADGTPVAGVTVCYEPSSITDSRCTTTDASGQYQLSLAPGAYTDSLLGDEPLIQFFELHQTATVPSPPAIIRLAATRSTPIRIVNTDGSPHAGAFVAADCVEAPASGSMENICGRGLTSDAAGTATVADPIGVPLDLQIGAGPGLETAFLPIDKIAITDDTELTIAIQSPVQLLCNSVK
jgi:hypothetical protein